MATKQKLKSKTAAKRPTRKVAAASSAKKAPASSRDRTVRDRQTRRAMVSLAALVRGQYSRLSSNNQELARIFLAEADKCEG